MSGNTHTTTLLAKVKQEVKQDPYLSETFLSRLIEEQKCSEVVQALQSMCSASQGDYVVPLGLRWRTQREIAAEKLLREIQPELRTWALSQVV